MVRQGSSPEDGRLAGGHGLLASCMAGVICQSTARLGVHMTTDYQESDWLFYATATHAVWVKRFNELLIIT